MTDGRGTTTGRTIVLLGCVLLTVAGVGFAIAGPSSTEPYTGFAVLSPDGDRLAAEGYPTADSENGTVVVAVTNQEGRAMDYTVVATAQRVAVVDGGDRVDVKRRAELGRAALSVDSDATGHARFDVTEGLPDGEGRLRVVFRLYRGDAPDEPHRKEPYRRLHLWLDGTADGGGTENGSTDGGTAGGGS